MQIEYRFVTGEVIEIEVDDDIAEVIIEIEEQQSKRNRAESRKHTSFEFLQDRKDGCEPLQFPDSKADVEKMVETCLEKEWLYHAIEKLEEKEITIVKKYYFEDKTMSQIGREMGMSAMAVSKRLKKISVKLKKFSNLV